MRILIISQYFYPENFRINQLASELTQRGHQLVVLTGQPNYPSGEVFLGFSALRFAREKHDGYEIIRIPLIPRGSRRSWQLVLNYISFVISATLFGLPRLRGRFDVCLAYCPSPITAAIPAVIYRAFLRTPVALWLQDLWPDTFFAVTKSDSRILKTILGALVRWIYAGVDMIWLQSSAYNDSVRALGGRPEQIADVPNWGEDIYDIERSGDLKLADLPDNSLLFAGNLGKAQRLETIVDAAELARSLEPRAHWVIVGDGTQRSWLASEIERRSLQSCITLLPRKNPEEMQPILQAAAGVLVVLGDEPVFGMTVPSKLPSTMAAGRPIIAALNGESARILLEAQCGMVCPSGDAAALATKVRDFFTCSPEERECFGRNGYAYYRAHFGQSDLITRIEQLLKDLSEKARV